MENKKGFLWDLNPPEIVQNWSDVTKCKIDGMPIARKILGDSLLDDCKLAPLLNGGCESCLFLEGLECTLRKMVIDSNQNKQLVGCG